MTLAATEQWTQHTRHTLKRYDEALLRKVAHKLCKPRNQWPVRELLDRVVAALDNAAMVDRRLKDMPAACRQALAVIARSRQVRWPVGTLVEILVALGHGDGLAPLVTLLESGLLLPELYPLGTSPDEDKPQRSRLKDFPSWLSRAEPMPMLLASPQVTRRAQKEDLGIACPQAEASAGKAIVHEADGLEWLLRVAVLWQQLLGAPLRRTQQGDYFKRDADRLQADALLSAAPADALAPMPDVGFFTAALATSAGLLREEESELRAADFPPAWSGSLADALLDCWHALLRIATWNPARGYVPPTPGTGNPYPSAYLLSLLLLSRLPDDGWARPSEVETWVAARHPFWANSQANKQPIGSADFLLSVAHSLRLVQLAKSGEEWLVRLSLLGQWAVGGGDAPPAPPAFHQTLLVQPNLEILAYRQGLNPDLIASLSKIATWKTLGPACTLQLEPHSVYRALEMGESQTSIVHLLESHGMKAIPPAVLDSLKTWSSKRERISVWPAGAIFEFGSAAEMSEAIARGLPAVRLTDRLAVVADEGQIEYKNFRLTGTRDYTLPPERCVDVEPDGVTLCIDLARSDLLLETELQRFAEPLAPSSDEAARGTGRRCYRVTPASIAAARRHGVTLSYLQTWFAQRTGMPISAAALLLLTAPCSPVEMRRQIILHVPNEHIADGLQQWPGTREIVKSRVGPTALAVAEEDVPLLTQRLAELGVEARLP